MKHNNIQLIIKIHLHKFNFNNGMPNLLKLKHTNLL